VTSKQRGQRDSSSQPSDLESDVLPSRRAPYVATSLAKVRERPEAPASNRLASGTLPQGLEHGTFVAGTAPPKPGCGRLLAQKPQHNVDRERQAPWTNG
jgi:hypothetical protein